jgi:hypothetical protein
VFVRENVVAQPEPTEAATEIPAIEPTSAPTTRPETQADEDETTGISKTFALVLGGMAVVVAAGIGIWLWIRRDK